MSENRPVNGQDIGQAHYATRAVLERLLTGMNLSFTTSLVLNALAAGDGALPQSAVIEQLVQGLKVTEAEAESSVTVAVEQGLAVRTATDAGMQLTLTADGVALHRQTREGQVAISGRLYGGLPADDLIAAQRVLTAVRQRANAELARQSG